MTTHVRDQMTPSEVNDALRCLDALPGALGAEVPPELVSFMHKVISERDPGAPRLARFLREVTHVRAGARR